MSDAPLLEVADLAKSYGGVHAVRGVSLVLHAGEMLALIGPNGAGKTTLFNMLMGQVAPDRGTVRIPGQDVTGLAPRAIWRLGVGRTFQITATFASMTVAENVAVALLSHHRRTGSLTQAGTHAFRGEAMALLERVGMATQAERPCGVLAYGDLKRVELALALANAPRILLMDEPTAGMAPAEREELMRLVEGLAARERIGVLFTEHDMDAVFGHASRVLVLHRGSLIAEGAPAEIRANPQVQEVYLGSGAMFGAVSHG
jgi:branched-chain amino acid transport system ATP-binding protein